MKQIVEALAEQIIAYRELLALAYAQKQAIQNTDLARVEALLATRQSIIQQAKLAEHVIGALLAEQGDALPATATVGQATDGDALVRRLLRDSADLLGKLISMDKENERLLEVKSARPPQ